MTTYGNGYYTIVSDRTGDEYLVNVTPYPGSSHRLFLPRDWDKPYRSLGLRHTAGGGINIGNRSARSAHRKALRIIARRERRAAREQRRLARDQRFIEGTN
jgi:hypothetical protein